MHIGVPGQCGHKIAKVKCFYAFFFKGCLLAPHNLDAPVIIGTSVFNRGGFDHLFNVVIAGDWYKI